MQQNTNTLTDHIHIFILETDEQPLIWYLQIGMFDPAAAAAVATYLSRVLYSDLGGRSCIFLI